MTKQRISYEDWLENFDKCQIVNLTPDSIISTSLNVSFFSSISYLFNFNTYKSIFVKIEKHEYLKMISVCFFHVFFLKLTPD
jgi:hypothetical protein